MTFKPRPPNRRASAGMPRGIFSAPLWLMLKLYKLTLSPLISAIPGSGCRFFPTCSEYAMEAVARHGAFKGSILAACRLLRCHPFCRGGLDFVPVKFEWKKLFSQNKVDDSKPLNN